MINSFILSFKLKNAYRVNTIIYTLKHTPLIKKVLPYSLYTNKCVKVCANIISTFIEIINIFVWKLLYLLIFYYLIVPLFENQTLAFINIFVFLTVIGGIANTFLILLWINIMRYF